MNKLTEDEVISYLYNCTPLPEEVVVTTYAIKNFLLYAGELPSKYNIIKRELILLRNNFRTTIKYLSHIYILKLVTIFLTYRLKGNTLPRKYISFIINNHYDGSSSILKLSNYFVTVYMPEKTNLFTLDKGYPNRNILFFIYIDICSNLYTNIHSGFENKEISDILDFLKKYPLRDQNVVDIGEMLIGFYYLNHEKYNLSLDDLLNALDDRERFDFYLEANSIEVTDIDDDLILSFFHKKELIKA